MNKFIYILFLSIILCDCVPEPEPILIPAAPTDLVIVNYSDTEVEIAWTDNSDNEFGFRIERKSNSETYTDLGWVDPNITTFIDDDIEQNTIYTYRVYAFNRLREQSDYSNEAEVLTNGIPILSNPIISDLGTFTANIASRISSDGGSEIKKTGIIYGIESNISLENGTKILSGFSGREISGKVRGLEWETTYYVRAYATNDSGIGYSEVKSFTTKKLNFTAREPSVVGWLSAYSGASFENGEGTTIIEKGIVWGLEENPTVDLPTKITLGAGSLDFISEITGLVWDTVYYVRAYAKNSKSTVYSNQVSLHTLPITVLTLNTVDISLTSAESGASIFGEIDGAVTAKGVVWDINPNPTIDLATKTDQGTGTETFASIITDLSPNTTYYVRSYVSNALYTTYGTENEFKTKFAFEDAEGNLYTVVKINNQIWMAENLRTSVLNDNMPIPNITDATEWANATSMAYSVSNNDDINNLLYGKLYNGYTIETGNLCPIGWHVPTDVEWTELIDFVGGAGIAGGKLKSEGTSLWLEPNTGATNAVGFNLYPGGNRFSDGGFYELKQIAGLWSSTESEFTPGNRRVRVFSYDSEDVIAPSYGKNVGFSVRCVMD